VSNATLAQAAHRVPDGRRVEMERTQDGDYWHLRIQPDPSAELVGTPEYLDR